MLSAVSMHSRFVPIAVMAIGLLVSTADTVSAAEYSVPGDFATIKAALDASAAGDVIRVGPGIYQENLDFTGKDIELIGTAGAASTVIDAKLGTGVRIGPGGSITGFTIRNARASFGAGMAVSGLNSYIAFNIFEDNAQGAGGYGAAIGMNSASPVIDSNVFRRNTADNQFLSGVIGLVNGSSPLISNNVFYDNPCRAINATVPTQARPVIVNNTFVRNQTAIRVDRRSNANNQIFRNNILVDNTIGLDAEFGTEANNPVWENNLVSGNGTDYRTISNQTGINGNISADPLFVDPINNDFHLKVESPAIDAGNNMSAPPQDFETDARPVDGDGDGVATVDIGADELAFGINLLVDGGDVVECASPAGTTVVVRGAVFPDILELSSVELFLNGQPVATSLPAEVMLPFGSSLLEVVAATTDGRNLKGKREIEVVDTLAPVIHARFVDTRSGKTITSVDSRGMEFVTVKIDALDACDNEPVVTSVIGSQIKDGDRLRLLGVASQVILKTDEITLKVSASDHSGNLAEETLSLKVGGTGNGNGCDDGPSKHSSRDGHDSKKRQ